MSLCTHLVHQDGMFCIANDIGRVGRQDIATGPRDETWTVIAVDSGGNIMGDTGKRACKGLRPKGVYVSCI